LRKEPNVLIQGSVDAGLADADDVIWTLFVSI